jgi:6-phosphogluconolactonase
LLEFDAEQGTLSPPRFVAKNTNASFLVADPQRRVLYSTVEVGSVTPFKSGSVESYRVDLPTGDLTKQSEQPSGGAIPCHISLDVAKRHLFVANYSSGNVAVLPLDSAGTLQPHSALVQHEGSSQNPDRQQGPRAHSIKIDPTGKYVMAADLGCDKLFIYRYDADSGTLEALDNSPTFPPGSGPRHFAFHPNGKILYVLNELLNTMAVFTYDASTGAVQPVQTIETVPKDFRGANTTAEVVVHPSEKFVYASNRGHDSIAAFAVDAASGKLTALGHTSTGGKTPRNFSLDRSGKWLLVGNENSNTLVVLSVGEDGKLKPTDTKVEIPNPACVYFFPE